MSAHEEAQRHLDVLRAQNLEALGAFPVRLPPAVANDVVEGFLRDSLNQEEGRDPKIRALAEQVAARGMRSIDDMVSEMLAEMQEDIEKTARARIDGLDLARRPLIGHMQTGQLNAVSIRVPGDSGAYLVLFHDQMPLFASKLSKAVAWAIPHSPADANGMMTFELGLESVRRRIEADPEVAERFANIVVTYAVTGSVETANHYRLPPGYFTFAQRLCSSLEYFVLGHEYAHILLGHHDTTAATKNVLPGTEAETLAYSWQQEHEADWMGMILSINAGIDHDGRDIDSGFLGIGLYFESLDVMDRDVSLLETGDENTRQLGSHPPADLRNERLRASLPILAPNADPADARVQTALLTERVQEEIIHLLWERTQPILLERRRRGVRAARTWRTIAKEAGDEPAPTPPNAPAPKQVRRDARGTLPLEPVRSRRRGSPAPPDI